MVDLKTRLGADPAAAAGAAGGVSADDGRHTPLKPSKERDALNPELAAFLRKVRCGSCALAQPMTGCQGTMRSIGSRHPWPGYPRRNNKA